MSYSTSVVESLLALKQQLVETGCEKQLPLIKLEQSGSGPSLNYNVPQKSSFTTYGLQHIKGLSQDGYLEAVKTIPDGNFFEQIENLSEQEIANRFKEDIQLNSNSIGLLPNADLYLKNINHEKSNLEAVALGKELTIPIEGTENVESIPAIVSQNNFLNEKQLARIVKNELKMPYVSETLGGFSTELTFIKKPESPLPYFMIIEEYTTSSFLGNYGAGRTLNTFSLLPGEKTTISVKTYKDITSSFSRSENILDSFSESSAKELEKQFNWESGLDLTDSSSSEVSLGRGSSSSVDANIGLTIKKILTFGAKASHSRNSSLNTKNTSNSSRNSKIKVVSNALDKHVANSNSNRNVEINTSVTETKKSGEETSTVRELTNVNKSRVLNFVFRQLLQEYISITYLSNIRIAFCNGYIESLKIVDIGELDSLLDDTVVQDYIEQFRYEILKNYFQILNHEGNLINFVEKFTFSYNEHESDSYFGETLQEEMFRIRKNSDTVSIGGMEFTVPGPILKVDKHVLRTSGVIAEALLGQGEALDCFNIKAQDSLVTSEILSNMEHIQKIDLLQRLIEQNQIEAAANFYKKVFGDCCDSPQIQTNS